MSEPVDIWNLSDLATPWCVHIAATLGVAGHMEKGISQIDELAAASGAHAGSLQRVLRHLAAKGLFAETSPGHFSLNEPARLLLNPGVRLGLDLDAFGGRMAYAWGSLLTAVRSGAPAYHTVFGRPFWDDLDANPAIAASFDELMGPGHGTPDPDVLAAGDWDSIKTIVDVGGGTGALLAEILRVHPAMHGILVDLPSTIARAPSTARMTTIGQSFFEPLPAGADLYLMKSILANWPDPEALKILERCAEAARPNGRIVLLNGVSPDEDGPASPALLMMVLIGGKDRTLSEFRELAAKARLEVSATARQPSGRFLVECRPNG